MRCQSIMFFIAVCLMFLIKLRWPIKKNIMNMNFKGVLLYVDLGADHLTF